MSREQSRLARLCSAEAQKKGLAWDESLQKDSSMGILPFALLPFLLRSLLSASFKSQRLTLLLSLSSSRTGGKSSVAKLILLANNSWSAMTLSPRESAHFPLSSFSFPTDLTIWKKLSVIDVAIEEDLVGFFGNRSLLSRSKSLPEFAMVSDVQTMCNHMPLCRWSWTFSVTAWRTYRTMVTAV
jgi:hypothetical protein